MAIFDEKQDTTKKHYLALLDAEGEMVAIINPMSKLSNEVLMEALTAKGLSVEIRESKPDITTVTL